MAEIPTAAISRLVTYMRVLEQLEASDETVVSSQDLALASGGTAFQVRKDLAYFGRFGTRGKGYSVPLLRRELMRVLGLNRTWKVVIIGVGRLGQAIAHYTGASDYRFQFVGLFDTHPQVIGQRVGHLEVQPMTSLPQFVKECDVDMGFLAVPPLQAQAAAQSLAEAGIRGILNFAPVMIQPRIIRHSDRNELAEEWRGVTIENVDFLVGMKRLAFYTLNPHLAQSEMEE